MADGASALIRIGRCGSVSRRAENAAKAILRKRQELVAAQEAAAEQAKTDPNRAEACRLLAQQLSVSEIRKNFVNAAKTSRFSRNRYCSECKAAAAEPA